MKAGEARLPDIVLGFGTEVKARQEVVPRYRGGGYDR